MATIQILAMAVLLRCVSCGVEQWPKSVLSTQSGHYPPSFLHATNVVFSWTNRSFVYNSKRDEHSSLHGTSSIWPITNADVVERSCDERYKTGVAYTIFYFAVNSNYYHLTYDMLIPLYKHMYFKQKYEKRDGSKLVFMPTVETSRLKILDWETPAFENSKKYWMAMTEFIAGDSVHLPLNKKLLESKKNLCFDELYFGVPRVDFRDEEFIRSYVKFVKNRFNIQDRRPSSDRMVLVSRKGRRKILNEVALVEALQEVIATDLLEFGAMTFEEQVQSMQNYTVFAALNGAGLMNSLYLPEHSTAIQMAPYQSGLNVKQYGDLIKTRGPYLEWINTHDDLNRPTPGDKYNNKPDTIVHIEEFKDVVRQAIELSKESYLKSLKTEF